MATFQPLESARVTNRAARKYVQECKPFEASNLFAVVRHGNNQARYIVYSYGTHFPLWIREGGVWYENVTKYNPTTTKHKTQTNPYAEATTPMEREAMVTIANHGIAGLSLGMGEGQ